VDGTAVAGIDAVRAEASDDTFERLHDALYPGAPRSSLRFLLRRRVSTLVLVRTLYWSSSTAWAHALL
jgi:hypothetical protein